MLILRYQLKHGGKLYWRKNQCYFRWGVFFFVLFLLNLKKGLLACSQVSRLRLQVAANHRSYNATGHLAPHRCSPGTKDKKEANSECWGAAPARREKSATVIHSVSTRIDRPLKARSSEQENATPSAKKGRGRGLLGRSRKRDRLADAAQGGGRCLLCCRSVRLFVSRC